MACGVESDGAAGRCPACGLVWGAENAPTMPTRTDQPGEWAILGLRPLPGPPVVDTALEDASSVAVAQEPRAAAASTPEAQPPSRTRRAAKIAFVAVAVLAAAVVAVLVLTPRHDPQAAAFERYFESGRLAGAVVDGTFDPDAPLRALEAELPDVVARARELEPPLASAPDLHVLHDEYMARWMALDPDAALSYGAHPHPHTATGLDDLMWARRMVLDRHAWTRLGEHAPRDPHEEVDRALFASAVELALRAETGSDRNLLLWMQWWLDPLVRLQLLSCCSDADRADAALARLQALPALLESALAAVEEAPPGIVHLTIDRLGDADEYLAHYAADWKAIDAPRRAAMRRAAAVARSAVVRCAARLRHDVLPLAEGPSGIGRDQLELRLRREHLLPYGAEEMARLLLAEYRDAGAELHDVVDRIRRTEAPRARGWGSPEQRLRAMSDARREWVATVPPDAGLAHVPMPLLWRSVAGAVHLSAGPLAPAKSARLLYTSRSRTDDLGDDEHLQHVLAHEGIPGHHLEECFARTACTLRRIHRSDVFTEGWAVYAEDDLLHATDLCDGGLGDAWARGTRRRGRAWMALAELVVHTAASDEEALDVLRAAGYEDVDLAAVGACAEWPGRLLVYAVGHREILRLRDAERSRLGVAFDARTFHVRLLSAGPLPPALHERLLAR